LILKLIIKVRVLPPELKINNYPIDNKPRLIKIKKQNFVPHLDTPYICLYQTWQKLKELPLTNNDILRRIRYIFDYSDSKMIKIFALGGKEVSRAELSSWLRKKEHPDYQSCRDILLATFLNGLIIDKRGRKEGKQPLPKMELTNNIIFRKLAIALKLQADDILEILGRADFSLGKHELSAFFRKPGHKHYRECKDQVLRNFLAGLQDKVQSELK